jgi:membrane-associated phospholipid phosphatase
MGKLRERWVRGVVRRALAKVVPFVATPVAIGAGITAGALAFFFHITDDIRGKEQDGLWKFDHAALDKANSLRTPTRTRFFLLVSDMAKPDTMTRIGIGSFLVALLVPRWRPRAMLLAVALAGGGAMIGTMKYRYARARPTRIQHLAEEYTFSFPSGHSFIAAVFYGLLGALGARSATTPLAKVAAVSAALKMILLIGASRVYLGVHYPSDVLAGYAAATPWLVACLIGYRQFELRSREEGLLSDDAEI